MQLYHGWQKPTIEMPKVYKPCLLGKLSFPNNQRMEGSLLIEVGIKSHKLINPILALLRWDFNIPRYFHFGSIILTRICYEKAYLASARNSSPSPKNIAYQSIGTAWLLEIKTFLKDWRLAQVIDEAVSRRDFKRPQQLPAFWFRLVDLQHFRMLLVNAVKIG